jgi:hypothetical protein
MLLISRARDTEELAASQLVREPYRHKVNATSSQILTSLSHEATMPELRNTADDRVSDLTTPKIRS